MFFICCPEAIPICTEAEATSSVIAAEALQLPVRDFALYPSGRCGAGVSGCGQSPTPTRDVCNGYGGGRRQWSPTMPSQMDDFDTLFITSLYQHNDTHDLSWHPGRKHVRSFCLSACLSACLSFYLSFSL